MHHESCRIGDVLQNLKVAHNVIVVGSFRCYTINRPDLDIESGAACRSYRGIVEFNSVVYRSLREIASKRSSAAAHFKYLVPFRYRLACKQVFRFFCLVVPIVFLQLPIELAVAARRIGIPSNIAQPTSQQ